MRYWMTFALLACGALSAAAQGPWRDRDYRYGDRDDRYGYGRDRSGYGAPLIDRVLSDLDRVGYNGYVDHHERKHFENARRDLLRFQENWQRGRFDRDRLDSAIENLHHLADADQLDRRERRILARDMDALRDFRSDRGRYGYDDRYRPY